MNRQEILEKIEEKIVNFSFYDSEIFSELTTLTDDDIYFQTEKAILVTPLLTKLCDYCIICQVLNNFEINEIIENIKDTKELKVIEEVLDICELANEFITELYEDSILHPLVSMTNYKVELLCTQEEYYENLNDFIAITDYSDEKHNILDLLTKIDEISLEKYEDMFINKYFLLLKEELKRNQDIEMLLEILISYTDKKMYLESGIEPFTSLMISDISKIINEVKNKTSNDEERNIIEICENRCQKVKSVYHYYRLENNKCLNYKKNM